MLNPEARLLRYFLVLAEDLNFTRAAKRIGLSQPALSVAIRQLEAQLGVRLLVRSGRSVSLTEAGRVLQEGGPAALRLLDRTWESARRAGQGEFGLLRLAYSPSASYDTAPRLVVALRAELPDVEVAADMRAAPQLMEALASERLDLGVARKSPLRDGVRAQTIRRERRGVLVAATDRLADARQLAIEDIADRPVLLHARELNPVHFDEIIDLFAAVGGPSAVVERPVAFDPTHSLVAAGQAIQVSGESSTTGLVPGLRWVPLTEDTPPAEVQLIYRAGPVAPLVERCVKVVADLSERWGWLTPARDAVPSAP